jgi:hypothetical protein
MTDEERSGATNGTNHSDNDIFDSAIHETDYLDDDIYDSTVNDVDQRILQLLECGLSYKKISRQLKSEGIELSPTGVCRHVKELRQDPDNNVRTRKPYTQKPREQTREYQIIAQLKKNMIEYEKLHGIKPSFRTMAYELQDQGKLKPKEVGWLNNLTVQARLGWKDADDKPLFPHLDIDCFPDGSRLTLGERDDIEGFKGYSGSDPQDPEEYINDCIVELKNAPSEYDGRGTWGRDDVPGGRWFKQPEVVEVWDEKNDLLESFHKLLEGKGIKIRANKGWGSLEFLYRCTEELKPLIERFGVKHIHILYAGDWDASGAKMEDYIKRRLKQLGLEGLDIRRIAVTPEQIDKYNLPLMDIESESNGGGNSNLKEFIRKYGRKATHLNAFFTKKHIGDFKKILIEEVDRHWNKQIYEDMLEEYSWEAPSPTRYSSEELKRMRIEMVNKITNAFYPGWEQEGYTDDWGDDDEDLEDEDDTDEEENDEDEE